MTKNLSKRLKAIAMTTAVICGSLQISVLAEDNDAAVTVQSYSEEVTADRSENPYSSAYYGLWSLPVEVDESTSKNIYVYTPTSYYPCCQMLFVVAPSGVTAEEFANQSAWISLAEKYSFGITFVEGDWNTEDPATDVNYILAAVQNAGTLIDAGSGFRYIVGYGDGATIAQNFILNYPSLFAGAVTFGAADIPEAAIQEAGEKPSCIFAVNGDFETTYENSLNKDVEMPVWVINDGNTNDALIGYWKQANNIDEEGLSNEYAAVYNQNDAYTVETYNDKAISRVWVSDISEAAEKYDEEFTEYVWNNFLSELYRFSAEPNGGLRNSYTAEEAGLVRETIEVDGTERSWLLYVPSNYDGTEELPLVVALHGFTATSECMMVDSEWWKVAEERNLAVVFPLALSADDAGTATPRWANTDGKEKDLDFINAMLDQLCEAYSIDESRIYCTGHSNGGFETDVVGENIRERFAAIANVGGAYSVVEYADVSFDGIYMPSWLIVGEYDLANQAAHTEGTGSYSNTMKKLAANGIDSENGKKTEYDNGGYYNLTFYATEENIPMVQFSVRADFNHTYAPEFSWKIWDEFFSKYSRGEDGTLYYCGNAVQ